MPLERITNLKSTASNIFAKSSHANDDLSQLNDALEKLKDVEGVDGVKNSIADYKQVLEAAVDANNNPSFVQKIEDTLNDIIDYVNDQVSQINSRIDEISGSFSSQFDDVLQQIKDAAKKKDAV